MVFDVELILDAKRRDAELGEQLLGAFLAAAPASDPIIDQDTESGRTTVAFEVEAGDVDAAFAAAIEIVRAVASRLGGEGLSALKPAYRLLPTRPVRSRA